MFVLILAFSLSSSSSIGYLLNSIYKAGQISRLADFTVEDPSKEFRYLFILLARVSSFRFVNNNNNDNDTIDSTSFVLCNNIFSMMRDIVDALNLKEKGIFQDNKSFDIDLSKETIEEIRTQLKLCPVSYLSKLPIYLCYLPSIIHIPHTPNSNSQFLIVYLMRVIPLHVNQSNSPKSRSSTRCFGCII